ncbi:MAG TPA: hypothetical protein DCP90_04635 [Clostridiales bacterium]|nr:MAG: hypothetical protein A2Y22_06630 [Clostridiales bacterium GWD2_32_59]HAN09883.1 hypothetical protein [Clostridiales bacterium]
MFTKSKYTWVLVVIFIAMINILYASDEKNNIIRLESETSVLIQNENLDITDQRNLLYETNIVDTSNSDIFVHQKTSYEDIKNSKLIEFDNNGNVIDDNILSRFPDKNELYKINKIVKTADDGFLIVQNSDADLPVNFTVKKVDKSLNELWTKKFDNKGTLILITALTALNDGYVVSGYGYDDIENGKSKFVAYKLDNNGKLLYNIEHTYDANFMPFRVISNKNDIIVCGKTYEGNTENIWITYINTYGDISWKRNFTNCTILGQSELLNNNFAIVVNSNKDLPKNKFRMMQFDLLGNKIWEKIYTPPYKYEQFKTLCSEDKYILLCKYSTLSDHNDEITTKYRATAIDNAGHLLWEEDVGILKNKKIEDMKRVKNNTFLIIGTGNDIMSKNDILWVGKFITRKYILR